MNYLMACATDIGFQKDVNQDSLLVKKAIFEDRQIILAVLCDGMGGLKRGEAASASVVKAFSSWFEKSFPNMLLSLEFEAELSYSWTILIRNMNEKIRTYGWRNRIQLGTTLTAMLLLDEKYYIAHVGDSRVYELTDRICQLTKDQTLVQREVDRGRMTERESRGDVRRSILLQCVGVDDKVKPVFIKGNLAYPAVYLLCSDGFRHVISSQEMFKVLKPAVMRHETVMESKLYQLVELNKSRGEVDDISAIALRTCRGDMECWK